PAQRQPRAAGGAKKTTKAASAKASSSFNGMVTDQTGTAIVGATVTVTNSAGVKQTGTSDDKGNYSIKSLDPGTYNLSVTAKGYKVFEAQGINLSAREDLPVDAALDADASAGQVNAQAQPATAPADNSQQTAAQQTTAQTSQPAAPSQTQADIMGQILAQTAPAPRVTVASKGAGSINGNVTDQTGAVIAGAQVTVTGTNGVKQTGVTNDQGNYLVT